MLLFDAEWTQNPNFFFIFLVRPRAFQKKYKKWILMRMKFSVRLLQWAAAGTGGQMRKEDFCEGSKVLCTTLRQVSHRGSWDVDDHDDNQDLMSLAINGTLPRYYSVIYTTQGGKDYWTPNAYCRGSMRLRQTGLDQPKYLSLIWL